LRRAVDVDPPFATATAAAADAIEGEVIAERPADFAAIADFVPAVVGRTVQDLDGLAPAHDRDDVGPGPGVGAQVEGVGADLRRGGRAGGGRGADPGREDGRRQYDERGEDANRADRLDRIALPASAIWFVTRGFRVGIDLR
jgi:hypothetical protein